MIKRNTAILIVVFAVVLGAALFLQKTTLFKPTQSPSATPNPPLLGDTSDQVIAVRLTDQHGLNILAKLGSDNQWSIEQPAGLAISQGSMQEIISDLNGMSVQSIITNPLPLTSTGLQLPTFSLTLTYQSGQTHVIKVGSLTPTQSGYYVQLDTGNTVVIGQSGIDNVVEMLKSVTYTPTPTTPAASNTPEASPTGTLTPVVSMTPTP